MIFQNQAHVKLYVLVSDCETERLTLTIDMTDTVTVTDVDKMHPFIYAVRGKISKINAT